MIKVKVIKDFTLKDYQKIEKVQRATSKGQNGYYVVGDTFECDEEMAKYLMGENAINEVVVEVVEVIPDAIITEPVTEVKEEPKEEKKKPNKKKKK